MIDNYDSFTYNLVNQFRMLDAEVVVFRNDTPLEVIFTAERISQPNTVIVISPGPGNPDTAGNSLKIIKKYASQFPILGICLGHQSIVQEFGGKIGQAKAIVHGKADDITFSSEERFSEISALLPTPMRAARYHSLTAHEVPDELSVIAKTQDEVMAVAHRTLPILGFQFHPESILTTHGSELLRASLKWLTKTNN